MMLELEDKEDMLWSKKGWDLGEKELKRHLDNAFDENQVVDKQYWVLKYYATTETDCGMKFWGRSTSAGCKSGTRQSTKNLDKEFIKAMDGSAKIFE